MRNPFHDYPGSPSHLIDECPFAFTGNADEDWHDFFRAAWALGRWGVSYDEGDGPVLTYKVLGVDTHPDCTADGIELRLTDGWRADLWCHFSELLHMLPNGWPDGDLAITNQPGDDGVVLRLWHD